MALCWSVPAAAERSASAAYALVIGNNYNPSLPHLAPLKYADDDAVRFSRFLDTLVDEVELLTLMDERTQAKYPGVARRASLPTKREFFRAVARLRQRIAESQRLGRRVSLYFVFSGHGHATSTGTTLVLADDVLTGKELFEAIDQLKPDFSHVIVDPCEAQGILTSRGTTLSDAKDVQGEPLSAQAFLGDHLIGRENVGVLFAAPRGQQAHEYDRIESGLFTFQLLSGAIGAADINSDEVVEYSEIGAFIGSANAQVQDIQAQVRLEPKGPRQDLHIPLFSLKDARKGTVLRATATEFGRFQVHLSNGERYAEGNIEGKQQVVLLLPPGPGEAFVKAREGERTVDLYRFARAPLDAFPLLPRPRFWDRGAVLPLGLFARPYDASYYLGFVSNRNDGITTLDSHGERNASDGVTLTELSWILGGLGAGAGTVALTQMSRLQRKYDANTLERRAQELEREYNDWRTAALVGFAVGVAGFAAGTALWLDTRADMAGGRAWTGGLSGTF